MIKRTGMTNTFLLPGAWPYIADNTRYALPGSLRHLPYGAIRSHCGHWSHSGNRAAIRIADQDVPLTVPVILINYRGSLNPFSLSLRSRRGSDIL